MSKEYRPIREVVIERAEEREMTAYAIAHEAKRTGGSDDFPVSINHVSEYLAGRKDMTGQKLDAVLRVLGLRVR
jgi:CRISPR/Cas system CMR-associated protein Cmr5 small subunit